MISSKKKVFATMGTVLMLLLVVFSAGCISNTTITYYVDGTQWYKTDLISFVTGDEPQDPVKDGYTFGGWYFDRGTWNEPLTKTVDGKLTGSEKVSVYAYFVKVGTTPTTIITYYVDGKQWYTTDLDSFMSGSRPQNPIKKDYTFEGWYLDNGIWNEAFSQTAVTTLPNSDRISVYAYFVGNKEPIILPSEEKMSAPHYLTDYSVTPVHEYLDIFHDNEKIYIRYKIAEVHDATLSELAEFHNSGGLEGVSIASMETWNMHTEESLKETINDVVSYSIEASLSGSVSLPVLSIFDIGLDASIGGEYGYTTEKTTQKSIETTVDHIKHEMKAYDFNIANYPTDNLLYRIVMKGDCEIIQTLVYNLDTEKIETSQYIIDCVVIGEPKLFVESCERSENFKIPEFYNSGVTVLSTVDVSEFLTGLGTVDNPYQISDKTDLLIMQFDKNAKYKLMHDLNLGSDSWFIPAQHTSNLNTESHTIFYDNGKQYPFGLIEIWNTDDFLNKVMLNPNGDYILMNNIDLTGVTLNENVEFTGKLIGNNKVITGNAQSLNLKDHHSKTTGRSIIITTDRFNEERFYGLFAKNSGHISGLTLSNFRIIGKEQQHNGAGVNIGCVAGENSGTISDVVLKDCWIECFRTYSNVGSVAGVNTGTITNCAINQCYVYGCGNAGGVVGINSGIISLCDVIGSGSDKKYNNRFVYVNKRKSVESSWGGIVGEATSDSQIIDVSIRDALIVTRFQEPVKVNVGYLVGKNAGSIVGYTMENVDKLLHNTDKLPDVARNSYFVGTGIVGYSEGRINQNIGSGLEQLLFGSWVTDDGCSITFNEDLTITGNMPLNIISGKFVATDELLVFESLRMSSAVGSEELMMVEVEFTSALDSTEKWMVQNGQLTLLDEHNTELIVLNPI